MNTSDFYYDLPKELIAQDPLLDRSSSRLLIMNKNDGNIKHDNFYNIINYFKSGDVLVLNETKVIPARLIGTLDEKIVEIFILKRINEIDFECLVKPGKKLRKGAIVNFSNNKLSAEIIDVLNDGSRIVRFKFDGIWEEVLNELGEMPLPPYIKHKLKDKNRYQTVYAKNEGSVAAPTAGLHFTNELIDSLIKKKVEIAKITLHVGLGTFRPVKCKNIEDHIMHKETFYVSNEVANIINKAKEEKRRVIACGTTSVRTLESISYTDKDGVEKIKAISGDTNIFIYPGFKFKIVDGLITNFHLPESTLLMLVSALCGRENILKAYNEAVKEKYRFFSFGDACFFI
ncbi:MAG: tRNA preQ1(34) S-adenosylmethionine ribosyltransferase-isomerase QueA [Eubacteriales bacterium]|nr:tRNA preQ1(34) S-adenosylmethionine ribosyltransferase-isomerase QueA [Eubacteriales bacterium]